MNTRTNQERKDIFLHNLNQVKSDTELILSQPQFIDKQKRIQAGIKSYSSKCPVCSLLPDLTCSKDCLMGENKSCIDRFWHPPIIGRASKEDFQKALKYLEYLIPILEDLPDFCYSESFSDSLREFIKHTDSIFEKDFTKVPKRKYPVRKDSYAKDTKSQIF